MEGTGMLDDAEVWRELAPAAKPLWDELEKRGWTDSWGGAEFERVFLATLNFIYCEANVGPTPA